MTTTPLELPSFDKPSRELDAWIHINVAGGKIRPPDAEFTIGNHLGDNKEDVPRYSSRRAAAFELACKFQNVNIDMTGNVISVQIHHSGIHYGELQGHRVALALLICRAAAMAKGYTVQ